MTLKEQEESGKQATIREYERKVLDCFWAWFDKNIQEGLTEKESVEEGVLRVCFQDWKVG